MSFLEQKKKEFSELKQVHTVYQAREREMKAQVRFLERQLRQWKTVLNRTTKDRRETGREISSFWQKVSQKKSRDRAYVRQNPGRAFDIIST